MPRTRYIAAVAARRQDKGGNGATTSTAEQAGGTAFARETMDVVTQLRARLVSAIGPCVGSVQRSRDVQKVLGVDVKLSWQVYRIFNTDEFLELALHMPTLAQMKKLLGAARKRGAQGEALAEVERGYAKFEDHVAHHAGDRASFDLILSRMAGGSVGEQVELGHRQADFEAQRYVWGIALDMTLSADIVHPTASREAGFIDEVHVRMRRGLQRLTGDGVITVDRRRISTPGGQLMAGAPRPLDEAAFAEHGVPLLPAFCSTKDLRFSRRTRDDGATVTEWMTDAVGRTSAVSLAFGERVDRVPLTPREGGRWGITRGMTFSTPTRTLISDLLVHRPTFGQLEHEVTRWGHAVTFPKVAEPPEAMGLPKLPCRDRVMYLGSGGAAAHIADVPEYSEMLAYACTARGWNLAEMDIYRVRVEYPLMHTLMLYRHTIRGS